MTRPRYGTGRYKRGHITITADELNAILAAKDGDNTMKTRPVPPYIDPIPVDEEIHISTMEKILHHGGKVAEEIEAALKDGKITVSEGMGIAYAIAAAFSRIIK